MPPRHETTAAAPESRLPSACRGRGFARSPSWARSSTIAANAIRHAPPGGTVTLGAERGEARLTITVEDSGAGVAPEMAVRLFEPFVTGRADGTGLGLAIARELADAHGGQLALRRSGGAGQGAVFALELPQEELPRGEMSQEENCPPS